MTISRVLKSILGTSLLAGALLLAPQAAQARVFVSVGFAPPAIPVYEQPEIPGDGYIWTPGYWAYTDDGYEWIDGAWVEAPYTGALWTPGYWGYDGGSYLWNAGYWGPSVGYYGGINYGFGYFGVGFYGGYWNHGAFFYNREYNHFGGGFRGHNFYNQRVGKFDGRPGGSSFARGGSEANRGGTFNRGGESFARRVDNGNGQSGSRQIAGVGRNTYTGGTTAPRSGSNGGINSFARPVSNGVYSPSAGSRGGFQTIQVRPVGGSGSFGSNLRPAQNGGVQANSGRTLSAAPQRSFSSGGGSARGVSGTGIQSGGGFHGGGGASHGGGHR